MSKVIAAVVAGFAAGYVLAKRKSPAAAEPAPASAPAKSSKGLKRSDSASSIDQCRLQFLDGALIVGVAGPSGSGKSSLCVNIQKRLEEAGVHPSSIAQLSFDSYYKGLEGRDPTDVNFDVPSALDTDLLAQHLKELRQGKTVQIPQYDFTTHSRLETTTCISRAKVIILDGIFTLAVKAVREQCDLTVFTIEDMDTCLIRRLRRDLLERGRDIKSVLDQYETYVKPGYNLFIQPSTVHADVLVPRARDNHQAQNTIVSMLLREK